MNEQQDTPDTRIRMSDAMESLTGFERIAIEDHWAKGFEELSSTRLVIGVIAVLHARDGMKMRDAWLTAKAFDLKATTDYFAPEAEEPAVDIDGEAEDAGKDGNEDETGPTRGSVSPLDRSPSTSTSASRKAS
jgi:hypothetical protein